MWKMVNIVIIHWMKQATKCYRILSVLKMLSTLLFVLQSQLITWNNTWKMVNIVIIHSIKKIHKMLQNTLLKMSSTLLLVLQSQLITWKTISMFIIHSNKTSRKVLAILLSQRESSSLELVTEHEYFFFGNFLIV